MLLAFALGSLGRDALKVAAALTLLLLFAIACLLSLLAGLTSPAAPLATTVSAVGSSTAGSTSPLPTAPALLTSLSPPAMGDTRWGSGLNTYCELYVEQRVGWGNQGATAYAAYLRLDGLGLVHHAPPDDAGEVVYFGPSPDNEGDGHVGIYDGDGRFTSITYFGLQQHPLAGWAAPYLGWVRPSDVRTDRFGNPVSPRG